MDDSNVIVLYDARGQMGAHRRLCSHLLDELEGLELQLAGLTPAIDQVASIGLRETAREQALLACKAHASIEQLRTLIKGVLADEESQASRH